MARVTLRPRLVSALAGCLLAYLAISHMVPPERAVDPNQMYLAAWEYVFPHAGWAIAATALFGVVQANLAFSPEVVRVQRRSPTELPPPKAPATPGCP